VPSDTQIRRVGAERKGLRILAVDDDPVSLRILEHHLTKDGHTVQRAMNGRQALIMALESSPQMIVTDWNMPEMDGLELAKSLRRSNESRGTYILLLTGREEEDRVVEAFDAGVDEYVVKPFNPKILLARVRAGQRMIELREQVESDRQLRDRQVAEMAVLNRKLEAAAMTDVLTKLPNRRYAMRRLEDELNGALAAGAPLSVIMIDIDHFKQVNDRFGHDMGDLVLRETATVLRNTTRKGDYVCRLGGEEFLVICTKASLPQCAMTAERIRAAVEEHIIGFGFERAVTVSLGAASLECGARTVDELLKLADRRVYAAKAAGRNRVCSNDAPPSQARSA
jgi:diguanylate cyclase (GGDEF)-like protein